MEIRIDEGEFYDVTQVQVAVFGCRDKCEYEKIREKNIKEREEAMKGVLEEINETKEEMNEQASRKRKELARKEKLSQNQPLNKRVASPLEIRRAGRLRVLDENADRSGKIDQNYKFAKKTAKRNKNLKEYNLPPLPLECELFIPPIKKIRKVANNEDLKVERKICESNSLPGFVVQYDLVQFQSIVDDKVDVEKLVKERGNNIVKAVGTVDDSNVNRHISKITMLRGEVSDEVCKM